MRATAAARPVMYRRYALLKRDSALPFGSSSEPVGMIQSPRKSHFDVVHGCSRWSVASVWLAKKASSRCIVGYIWARRRVSPCARCTSYGSVMTKPDHAGPPPPLTVGAVCGTLPSAVCTSAKSRAHFVKYAPTPKWARANW